MELSVQKKLNLVRDKIIEQHGSGGSRMFNSLCDNVRLDLYPKYGNLDITSNKEYEHSYFDVMAKKLTSYISDEKVIDAIKT
jgi:predicted N-formylglutamate amidohydrolase